MDFIRDLTPKVTGTWLLGSKCISLTLHSSKGLELIPFFLFFLTESWNDLPVLGQHLNPGNFSDISLPDLENSSGFGLTSHYTLPQIESYPHLLGMVYTLALINTKPEERKLVQSNWPETTLKVSLPNQENVSCKRGREIKIS